MALMNLSYSISTMILFPKIICAPKLHFRVVLTTFNNFTSFRSRNLKAI